MQAFSIELDNLPEHIREFLLSAEYFEFLFSLHETHHLSEEQDAALVKLIADLYEKRLAVDALQDAILSHVKCGDEITKQLVKEIFVNIILPLGDHFGDWREYFFTTIGTQDDVNASKTLPVILRLQQAIIEPRLQALDTVDYDQEALNVKKVFREQIVDLHASPDDNYKIALNGLIFDLLAKKTGYHLELIGEMLDNKETIGTEKITRNGARYEPLATEWIRDLHAFSSPDEVTSLSIAKYISQSPNARKLAEKERETLKRLFETYYTLRHFPDSLTKIPPEQWMIIPYDPAKIPGGVVAPTFPSDEVLSGAQPSKALLSELLVSKALSQKTVVALPDVSTAVSPVIPANAGIQTPTIKTLEPPVPAETEPRQVQMEQPASDSLASQLGSTVAPSRDPGLLRDDKKRESVPMEKNEIKPSSSPMPPKDYDKSAGDVIAQCGFGLSPDIAARLKTVIVTRLRNVRNDTQTKLRLMDPIAEGGIGLSSVDAEKVLDAVKTSAVISATSVIPADAGIQTPTIQTLEPPVPAEAEQSIGNDKSGVVSTFAGTTPSLDPGLRRDDSVTPPPPPTLSIEEDEQGVPVIKEEGTDSLASGSAAQVTTHGIPDRPATRNVGNDKHDGTSLGMIQKTPPASPPSAMKGAQRIPVQVRPGSTVGKVPMSDVKAPPRLLDAVGELRVMTIKDFRRLSPNPAEAASKVTAKIQLLEKDSYTKKMAGIEAWKENEVSQLYRDIGKESFGAGFKVGDVIEKRKNEGKPYLTQEEFEALLDLNENLRV